MSAPSVKWNGRFYLFVCTLCGANRNKRSPHTINETTQKRVHDASVARAVVGQLACDSCMRALRKRQSGMAPMVLRSHVDESAESKTVPDTGPNDSKRSLESLFDAVADSAPVETGSADDAQSGGFLSDEDMEAAAILFYALPPEKRNKSVCCWLHRRMYWKYRNESSVTK